MLAEVGVWCFDRRRVTVGLWLAAVLVLAVAAAAIGPAFAATSDIPDSESAEGLAVLDTYFPELGAGGRSGLIVFQADQGIDDADVTAAMEELFAVVNAGFPDDNGDPAHPGATVISPYSDQGQGQIARQGPLADRLAFAQVNLAAGTNDTESGRIGEAILERAPSIAGLTVLPGGESLGVIEPPTTELIGVAFAVIVLILAFGSVLAMGLPIAVAVGGVVAGAASTILLSNIGPVPDVTVTIGIMIGLGVGIDYALFIVTRYREGLHAGLDPRQAVRAAMDTAGRAVVFAGTTVVISMLGLLLVGLGWLGGMGIGISVTVLATMITSATLLPALLGFTQGRIEVTRWRGLIMAGFAAVALFGLGIGSRPVAGFGALMAVLTLIAGFASARLRRRVPAREPRPVRETVAYRWSRTIQRHPRAWFAFGAVVLLILATPVLSLRLGWSDEGNRPKDTYTRQAYDLMAEGFGEGFNGPFLITVVPQLAGSAEATEALREALAATAGVAAVTAPVPNDAVSPDAYLMSLVPTTAPQADATTDLVNSLRNQVIPVAVAGTGLDVKVAGAAAANIDITDFLAQRMFVFFGAVLALSFVLLMMVFRSLLIPLKAVLMNVLSIAAAFGVVVAVFNWGWGGRFLGIEGGPINPFIPMMAFAIVFGLSMDYEVFMLSRIREEYLRTGDAVSSVADGLAKTARVITAAAAIMVVVFGSFMFEDIRQMKLFGLGLALAVLLDATLVRLLLVPATMELLGPKNWWIPKWLDRVLPHVSLEKPGTRRARS